MFNVIYGSKINNLKTIQGFSRTPENIEAQQDVFQEPRTSFDNKFKDSPWRSRTSGNHTYQ